VARNARLKQAVCAARRERARGAAQQAVLRQLVAWQLAVWRQLASHGSFALQLARMV